MSFSDYLENVVLDYIFSSTVYAALSTADPLDDGSGIAEPVGNGYTRKSVLTTDWFAASGGTKSNQNAIIFNEASGAWGAITHFALFDALSGGNILASGALTAPVSPISGETPQFAAGDLDVSLT